MKGKFGSRFSYANVVATLALFVALGGTSFAAIVVTGKNVKNNSLTTKDIKNRSLLLNDFKAGQLPAGPRGATGPQGPQGAQGATGAQGAPGISGYQQVYAPATGLYDNPAGDRTASSITCPAGKKVLGGGAFGNTFGVTQSLGSSWPLGENQWGVHLSNTSGVDSGFRVYAICAVVP